MKLISSLTLLQIDNTSILFAMNSTEIGTPSDIDTCVFIVTVTGSRQRLNTIEIKSVILIFEVRGQIEEILRYPASFLAIWY